ncbi:MAG TPA: polyamine ABC transporter substrate-binding protein [Steroidobacteraceae bacterium]|nr:polyamine ABC transporter substrate-binding protein [Steroidobacteraceae bacterium]
MNPRGSIVLAAAFFVLCACGQHERPPAAASGGRPPDDHEKVLNLYNWIDYIAPDTIANFEKETGIKVRYDTYDNNEVLETKLLTGHTNYDVVIPTENFFDRQLRAGVYRKLDRAQLPNWVNTDPQIMRRLSVHDPGNLHAIPYMWTTTGLGYNVDLVRARLGPDIPDSWALLFDERNAQKLKDCGILVVDSPLDVFTAAIIYLGRDPNAHDPADVAAASEILRKIRPYVSYIDPAPIPPLVSGNVCLALAWSGDVEAARQRAIEASPGTHIAYFIPREGALMTLDMMAIPADAPHPHNAEIWMNYLLRPEVIARISNYIRYPNGNKASLPFIEPSLKNDPSVYPDEATRARLLTNSAVSLDYSRLVTREWTRFRTGQ